MAAGQGEDDARKVMCVIITDGQENSSREFSARRVRALVEERREKHGWEFIFLGANMDAIETAARYGIEADRAQSFHADPQGISLNFAVMSETVAAYRRTGKVEDEWKTSIAADYEQRRVGGKERSQGPAPGILYIPCLLPKPRRFLRQRPQP